jgi:hypothetical protein
MSIREIAIHSLGELLDQVTPEEPDPRTGRRRDPTVYRGSSDGHAPLLTTLASLGGKEHPHSKVELEAHLLRNFIRYSRPHLSPAPVNEWELLVTAQHHGLPTRLLDWTYSPLVAAHFATRGTRGDRDRAVWRLDWQRVHRAFDLPELALLIQDLEGMFGAEPRFTPWVLAAGEGVPEFACMLEPPSLDARIVVQAAVFTLCSDVRRPFDAFLASHGLEDALTRYLIPAAEVGRIRDQLDLAAVDERRLFPDIDGVAAHLRRYYS